MKWFPFALLLLTIASCRGPNNPAAARGEEQLARVFARLILVSTDARAADASTPEQVLNDAGMTREEFRGRVAEINRDPERWGAFIEQVQRLVEREAASLAPEDSSA